MPDTTQLPNKVAILHDTLLELGGAERVLHSLLELFPQAVLYTSLISPSIRSQFGNKHRICAMRPNLWQIGPKLSSLLKPFILLYWKSLKLEDYDMIISSSHSFSSKSILTKVIHLSYIHTPPKYLYEEYNQMHWIKQFPFSLLFSPLITLLRLHDITSAQAPTALIANSLTVQKRIKRYYKRGSSVIYPPVINNLTIDNSQTKEFFLFHSRLVLQKGLELAIRAFNKLDDTLVIVGEGPELKKLKKIARSNCRFVGKVPDLQLASIYAKTKALVFCGIDEDFGLVMAEALTAGIPIIGLRSSSTEEIVTNSQLGILFDHYSVSSLLRAINEFKNNKYSWKFCSHYAKKYSNRRFKNNFAKLVLSYLPQ